ncbi:MAG: cytochrome c [Bacteroidetes bacterium]|nr:cytochrome c [Bacteroidota bacterium]
MLKKNRVAIIIAMINAVWLISACTNDKAEVPVITVNCDTTYYKTKVKPVFINNCAVCHGPGGTSPQLDSYASIVANKDEIKRRIALPLTDSDVMPPDTGMAQANVDLIKNWINDGAIGCE